MSSRFQDRTFYYVTRFTSLRASQEISPLCVAKIERAIAISAQEKKHHLGYRKKIPQTSLSTIFDWFSRMTKAMDTQFIAKCVGLLYFFTGGKL